jgi:hypothetical protein
MFRELISNHPVYAILTGLIMGFLSLLVLLPLFIYGMKNKLLRPIIIGAILSPPIILLTSQIQNMIYSLIFLYIAIAVIFFTTWGCFVYFNHLKILDTSINNIDEIATKHANTELINMRISFVIKIGILIFILCIILLYGYHIWDIINKVSNNSLLLKLLSNHSLYKTELTLQQIQEISKNSFWLDDKILITFLIISASAISAGLITIVLLINSINSKKKDNKDLLDILQKPLTSLTTAEAFKMISVKDALKTSENILKNIDSE